MRKLHVTSGFRQWIDVILRFLTQRFEQLSAELFDIISLIISILAGIDRDRIFLFTELYFLNVFKHCGYVLWQNKQLNRVV